MHRCSWLRRTPPGPLTVLAALALALASVSLAPSSARADHPNALWRVVHDLCVPNKKITGFAAPCVAVDLKGGFAVVPDLTVPAQLVVVPTRRVTGIEDPQLLQPGTPNYWAAAWSVRGLLAERLGRPIPREAVAMAINAIPARSQEQLHIHLSCIRPDVAELLHAKQSAVPTRWSTLLLSGHRWRARALEGDDLGTKDPFKLLAAAGPKIAADMGSQTLIVVGATLQGGRQGFLLLSRTADPAAGYGGHGEFLLDKTCRAVS